MFENIIDNITRLSKTSDKIGAAVLFGSQARTVNAADQYSDIDVILFVTDAEYFINTNEWLNEIGQYSISFTENTFAGGKERRVLFDNGTDADFIFLRNEDISKITGSGDAETVFARGYKVLTDKIGAADILKQLPKALSFSYPSEYEFLNLVNDFWFHTVWTMKKIQRGELWVAKSCLDGYMKRLLLKAMELHARASSGSDYDTWHSGRFLENWAENRIIEQIPETFAAYSKEDMYRALSSTMSLFRILTHETAEKLNYKYPDNAENQAADTIEKLKIK